MILAAILSLVFVILAIIHFNWFFGGTYGFNEALPTKENGQRVLHPRKLDSLIVGFGLLLFGLFYFFKLGLLSISLPVWVNNYVSWIIPVLSLLRAMGDFKYVGFFKKIKKTLFARFDTKLFSPLCLVIGLFGFLINLLN